MASIAIPTNEQRLMIYIIDIPYGIRGLFPTSSFGLGLGVHDSCVFWITSSLNEQIKMGPALKMAQEYLDIDKVFEKFSLPQKICIAFDGVRNLEGYKI